MENLRTILAEEGLLPHENEQWAEKVKWAEKVADAFIREVGDAGFSVYRRQKPKWLEWFMTNSFSERSLTFKVSRRHTGPGVLIKISIYLSTVDETFINVFTQVGKTQHVKTVKNPKGAVSQVVQMVIQAVPNWVW